MNDLDDALRAMLRERARDINTVPAHLLRPDESADSAKVIDLAPRRRHTMQLIAASVVAVLALAGGLVGLQHVGGHGRPPSNSGAPQPSTPPVVSNGAECRATLPQAWHSAFTSTDALGAPAGSLVLAMSDTGSALISSGSGSGRDVFLMQPGQTNRTVYSVPDVGQLAAYTGAITGNYAVLPLYSASGSAGKSTVMQLDLIDLQSGDVTKIAGTSSADRRLGRHLIDDAVAIGDAVYWDVHTSPTKGVLMKYDLGTQTSSVAYTGLIQSGRAPIRTSAAGVIVDAGGGDFQLRVHAALPAEVSSRLNSQSALTVSTDGAAYAWFDQLKQTISWWSQGQAVRTVHTTLGQPDGDDSIPSVTVAGPYVFYSGLTPQVIDTGNGAVATLPNLVVTAGASFVGTYVDVHHTSEYSGVVDTSALPSLHC